MKMTAREIQELGVADEVVPEPLGGAQNDYEFTSLKLKEALARHLRDLSRLSPQELKTDRHKKFRHLGAFLESEN